MILDDMWMPYGRKPFPDEIRISPKRCGMTVSNGRRKSESAKTERKRGRRNER